MKTIFVLSGFDIHRDATDSEYDSLRDGLSNMGYKVIPVRVSWRNKTPTQYVEEFVTFYKHKKGNYNIVLGNSFGAVVTLLSTSALNPDEIYLCSLSPFFEEDKHHKPDSYWIRYFGKKRMTDLRSISFDNVASKIHGTKTTVIHGDKEYETSPPLVKRCEEAAQKIANAQLLVFKDTPHNMSDTNYVKQLLELF